MPILDGRVHEQVSSVLFFTVFFEGERHDLSKTGGFGRIMAPPPGKPVTFYECHPDDHAPAPSVRADFILRYPHCRKPAGGWSRAVMDLVYIYIPPNGKIGDGFLLLYEHYSS